MTCVEKVGTIRFDDHCLDVYDDVNEPLFKAVDVAKLVDYSAGSTYHMLEICEADEKLDLLVRGLGQNRRATFLTELGLYNILSQSRKPIARKWRRVVHDELIKMRRQKGMDIIQQFNEWDEILNTLYFDDETGILMQSITVQGGDVEQVPFEMIENG